MMAVKELYSTPGIYFIAIGTDEFLYCNDINMAQLIHIDLYNYQEIMIKNFNGFTYGKHKEIHYSNEQDAGRAAEWFESQYLVYKLIGE